MEGPTIERELMDLERRYWQALKDRDTATALSLTDETCIVTGPQGVGKMDRATLEKMMKTASYTLDDFELKDAQVMCLSDDVAVLAYTVHEVMTVEGKVVSRDAAGASTWVRRDGQWRCALHTESLTGDPFGRDRRAST